MEPSCSATSGRRDAERPPLRGGVVKLRSRESRAQRKRAVQLHLEQLARDLHLTGERQSVWALLPIDLLVRILKLLALPDRGRSAQVCTRWHATYHMPDLWHQFAFEFVQETALMASSTPASLIKQVTDSMRGILTNSPLKELAVAKTLIDDASLQTMADKSQATLTSLKINCCPALSASGITSVLGSCLHLCELTMDYHQVSDALLQAVSTPAHVPMKDISIRVVEPDSGDGSEPVPWQAISHVGWDSLSQHSPDVAFALHFLKLEEESYDHFFRHRLPATLLHFGCFIPRLVLCRVARHCPRLRTLLLANTGTDEPIDGPLAEIGERCLQLQEVQLSGALVSCAGLVCLAKLCGPRLTTLNIFEDMLLPDEECNEERMTQEVSHYLQRPWSAETFPTWPE
ncbi:F-box/LRR-repeat protein 21-like isoform X2 [Acanthaster planci]|uniref:F-box/LRR-repeat protein 21-like isoform X2 n=1 Tax=Acanthaster planci TaxID=133434 RepID=A0A8B7Y3B5_ACAPL|nr:F-box/LRR-repeat protein 21-like isoform X2 [Acanthaster planci]